MLAKTPPQIEMPFRTGAGVGGVLPVAPAQRVNRVAESIDRRLEHLATGLVLHMPAHRHYAPSNHFGFADSASAICYQDGDYFVVDLPTWFC